jgi:hypothetical protein
VDDALDGDAALEPDFVDVAGATGRRVEDDVHVFCYLRVAARGRQ